MAFEPGQRVYSSTGGKSHIYIEVVGSGTGKLLDFGTACGRAVHEWWYPDKSLSLPLCRLCEKATE